MVRRIGETFRQLQAEGGKALIPFVVSGDAGIETTVRLVPELEAAGAHIVELGIPFSDPVADGPVIQRAAMRALAGGYGMADHLRAVEEIRKKSEIPILLFSYYNPVYQYGLEALARDAKNAGVDGILVTDVTPEEGDAYRAAMDARELDCVFLVAPTSGEERVAKIAACSGGFVYVVSRAGVTGARQALSDMVAPTVARVRRHTALPVAVGFGVSRPEQVRAVWEVADGAVVGSALVAEMEAELGRGGSPAQVAARAAAFCRSLAENR
ncbi:MAG: tryptophan synthase subunit alpha [Acidobacteriota bacterium]|jgi:tryptophan synthase alpha chain|nr:tryptophan synthase subunit alpha [Acidobacteriota bacterium]